MDGVLVLLGSGRESILDRALQSLRDTHPMSPAHQVLWLHFTGATGYGTGASCQAAIFSLLLAASANDWISTSDKSFHRSLNAGSQFKHKANLRFAGPAELPNTSPR
jgi:hypothetical protein